MTRREKQLFYFLFTAIGVVVLLGMFVPVMEVDAAQYASISKQMWQERSFLQIIHRDINYLDKPPLLFWLSGLSMGLFGFTDFAYKLPSVLFSVLGIWSTFRFAKHFYGELTGFWAALMYSSCVAFFVFNNDIRTDTLLINLLIFSIYQFVIYRDTGSRLAFLGTFVGIGLSMLAKGPLGLVFPVLAIGGDILMRRDWRLIFRWQWLMGLVIVALILLPMCIGLYLQFDARPHTWVNGEQGVSGLEFYFWTQSFGRITRDSVWATAYSNNPGPFFLTTSFLWAFLPWTPLFLVAFVIKVRNMVINKFKAKEGEEWITFFAFILPLLALSKSGYQLNHYIYVVLPFTAIMAG
ncbi:MAG: ArnT family glycosyltransferase, partial [Bacteroidia bacterium]